MRLGGRQSKADSAVARHTLWSRVLALERRSMRDQHRRERPSGRPPIYP